ncbi:hypothetical protein Y1Q_0005990 [Alligator mississippiensis]|uniref:Uncharacterized protein n=1 Tax=Alligator mississippiensis TaxID=8496 RepID=A0A151N3X7_ALLMI|nr:hypothetical protein Y1Q_0005990 [Alligator mississippiensis]
MLGFLSPPGSYSRQIEPGLWVFPDSAFVAGRPRHGTRDTESRIADQTQSTREMCVDSAGNMRTKGDHRCGGMEWADW